MDGTDVHKCMYVFFFSFVAIECVISIIINLIKRCFTCYPDRIF